MAGKRVLGIVLAGGAGKGLAPLTAERAKAAVPFGGLYRVVDFALSNLVNGGIRRICVLTQFGVGGMFTHWPIYALAAGAVAALFLEQAALHVGPLRASQPFMVLVDPIVSITLSVWLFAEHFTADAAVLAVAAAGFAVMCGGVVLLTQTAPATMNADTPNGKGADTEHGAASGQIRPASS